MKEPIEIVIESEVKNIEAEIEFSGERIAGGGGGATFVPSVDAEGNLSWSNDGDLPNPETVNIKGPRGEKGEDGYTPIKGVDYFDGEQGVPGYTPQKGVDYFDGQQGEKGDPFTYEDFTPEQLASLKGEKGDKGDQGERGLQGERGEKGEKGDKGDTGEKGADGTGVSILGSYASEAELIAAHPTGNIGDAYMVEGALYVWSATTNEWQNVGNIKGEKGDVGPQGPQGEKGDIGTTGPQGDKGETGEDGYSPTVAVSKSGKVTTVTITDKDGTKTATINDGADGAKGEDGYTPIKGVDYFDGANGKDGESIGIEDYDADDDYTTVVFTNGDVIQIPSGVGIRNIRLSGKSETGNTYEIELTNGQSYDFVAPAGPTGKTGADGTSVTVSKVSESTEDGGSNIVLFSDGKELTVKNGSKGDKGDTPVKGVDYFTEEEKTEMLGPVTTLAETAKSTADSANTRAREALENADEALSLADDAYDTATGAMQALDNLTALPNPNALTINGEVYDGSVAKDMTEAVVDAVLSALPTWTGGSY